MIRVLLGEEHHLMRSGIKGVLESSGQMRVIAEPTTADEAVRQARELIPDVILLDHSMPGMGAMEAIRRIRGRRIAPIVCLTSVEAAPVFSQLLSMGVKGLVSLRCTGAEIVEAVRRVHRGQSFVSTEVARQLVKHSLLSRGFESPIANLSRRELQVLILVTQGDTARRISEKLCLSPKTVSTYRYRICQKLGASNDVELTHLAMRHGLLNAEARPAIT